MLKNVTSLNPSIKTNFIKLDYDSLGKEDLQSASLIVQDFRIAPKMVLSSYFCDPDKQQDEKI